MLGHMKISLVQMAPSDAEVRRAILVVALDAALREAAFERLAAAGYRIDAVANSENARKRVGKDRYTVIVVEDGLEAPETTAPQMALSWEILREEGKFEEEVRRQTGE